ncbi:mannitol-1-phosphate 5-dehydrogenase [Aquipluma nitroreducens]|uniref:Mannitol-1-phosphate 5-dehydrogenase n=1 Tax=Aquipluma nitroreducens TaxID=2010828 RepID=A0A5K7SFN1_9BACT|nr:TIM barrel protein [Aquipluma nitroreducens]BBE20410.1 mannitol-1-phosphate 5-dehydrogenase [Aquipluma nitroreducens]
MEYKYGVHQFLWKAHWTDNDLPILDSASQMGCTLFELSLGDDVKFNRNRLRKHAESLGMELTVGPGNLWPENCNISDDDPKRREYGLTWHKKIIDQAAELGAVAYCGAIYGHPGHVCKRRPPADELLRTAENLRKLAEYAHNLDVKLVIEPMSKFRNHLINTAEQAMRLIDLSSHSNILVNLDTYHMITEERDYGKAIELVLPVLWGIHACENDRGVPGGGLVPWHTVFDALANTENCVRLMLETYNTGDSGLGYTHGIFQNLCPDPEEFVRKGLLFLKGSEYKEGKIASSGSQSKSFVGFGFGAIQSGLFLYEAMCSNNFKSFVIAEIDPALVNAVRNSGGFCQINVAHTNGISTERIGPIQIFNPNVAEDRLLLINAVAEADELATALPSVSFFDKGGEASVVNILSEGFKKADTDCRKIIYVAENHNQAAEILQAAVVKALGTEVSSNIQFLNTVIGKMSGIVTDEEEQKRLGIITMTPEIPKAILVEEFNRILLSKINLPGFERGIKVFEEKSDLLPFEEAKLYGHNAIHALIGYLAYKRGYKYMVEAGNDIELMKIAKDAFLLEAGAGLIYKYKGVDELFTVVGFMRYADNLLVRMVNPFLLDAVSRVIRDSKRKLGWDDRLIGAMRLSLAAGVPPKRLAKSVSIALLYSLRESWSISALDNNEASSVLNTLIQE